jgi:hypothetical protein
MALYFKPDHFKGMYGYTNEMTMEMCNTFTETFLRVARECIPTKMVTVRNSDRPCFNSEIRREIRKRDRIRKTAKTYSKQSYIDQDKKQKNKVNNLKKDC